ncbi:hypothetical protein DFH28DRAFT_924825 [Melampsora americana]|nr:hypothetical protein DFH28DRAFT_924825 [Melampsora americana]
MHVLFCLPISSTLSSGAVCPSSAPFHTSTWAMLKLDHKVCIQVRIGMQKETCSGVLEAVALPPGQKGVGFLTLITSYPKLLISHLSSCLDWEHQVLLFWGSVVGFWFNDDGLKHLIVTQYNHKHEDS